MPNNRVLCKFFTQGACLKGETCAFSHGQNGPSSNVCTFYQKGACTFGSRCKYEHIEVSQSLPLTCQIPDKPKNPENGVTSEYISVIGKSRRSFDPLDNPLCSFAAAGNCRGGQFCPNIHGDLCPTCGAHCLHPFKPQERQEHYKTCMKRQNHLQVLKHSQEVECSVCFERILSKSIPAERKFGILSECDHPFCISCIRNWRSSSSLVMDVNSVLRACPICRKVSYFVIPSVIWYSTKEEKAEIVDSYKKKLRSIDCKYFEFGNGTCPFGSSCFYKHIVKEGSMLWNATLMPEVWDSSYMNGGDETDLTFDGEDEDEDDLWTVVQTPLGVEEAGDFNLEEEDLNNAMASLMLLGLFEGGNNHDSSNNNNNNNYNNNNNNGV